MEDPLPPLAQAYWVLRRGGLLAACELHPFRQWQGAGTRFGEAGAERPVEACPHTIAAYVAAGLAAGLTLRGMAESCDPPSNGPRRPPPLLRLMFSKP